MVARACHTASAAPTLIALHVEGHLIKAITVLHPLLCRHDLGLDFLQLFKDLCVVSVNPIGFLLPILLI